jgi:formylglycine-generating enzyme required for sulfatase activity
MSALCRLSVFFFLCLHLTIAAENGWSLPSANAGATRFFAGVTKARTTGVLESPLYSSFPVTVSGGSLLTGNFSGEGKNGIAHVSGSALNFYDHAGELLHGLTLDATDYIPGLVTDINGDSKSDLVLGTQATTGNPVLKMLVYGSDGSLLQTINGPAVGDGNGGFMLPKARFSDGSIISATLANGSFFVTRYSAAGAQLWQKEFSATFRLHSIAETQELILLSSTGDPSGTKVLDSDGNEILNKSWPAGIAEAYITSLSADFSSKYLIVRGQNVTYPGNAAFQLVDPASGLVTHSFAGDTNVSYQVAVGDVTGNGYQNVVALSSTGLLLILDHELNLVTSSNVGTGNIAFLNNFNGYGAAQIGFFNSTEFRLYSGTLGLLLSESHSGIEQVIVTDLDQDGKNELVILADKLYVYTQSFQALTRTINGVDFNFVRVPPGTFNMGAGTADESSWDYNADESPRHEVEFSTGFWMQATELTQKQWKAVMGDGVWPSGGAPDALTGLGDDYPVYNLSYQDALDFVTAINVLDADGADYRLPTEAEWEYAARAATETPYNWRNTETITGIWAPSGAEYDRCEPSDVLCAVVVNELASNQWGLYGAHTNVFEWLSDYYNATYYASSPSLEPQGPAGGTNRVLRGGMLWNGWAELGWETPSRSARRYSATPTESAKSRGLRLFRDLDNTSVTLRAGGLVWEVAGNSVMAYDATETVLKATANTLASGKAYFDLEYGELHRFAFEHGGRTYKSDAIAVPGVTEIDVWTPVTLKIGPENYGGGYTLSAFKQGGVWVADADTEADSVAVFPLEANTMHTIEYTHVESGQKFTVDSNTVPSPLDLVMKTRVFLKYGSEFHTEDFTVECFGNDNCPASVDGSGSSPAEFSLPSGNYNFRYTHTNGRVFEVSSVAAPYAATISLDTQAVLQLNGQVWEKSGETVSVCHTQDVSDCVEEVQTNSEGIASFQLPYRLGGYWFYTSLGGRNYWSSSASQSVETATIQIQTLARVRMRGEIYGAGGLIEVFTPDNLDVPIATSLSDDNAEAVFTLAPGSYVFRNTFDEMTTQITAAAPGPVTIPGPVSETPVTLKDGNTLLTGKTIYCWAEGATSFEIETAQESLATDGSGIALFDLIQGNYRFGYHDGTNWHYSSMAAAGDAVEINTQSTYVTLYYGQSPAGSGKTVCYWPENTNWNIGVPSPSGCEQTDQRGVATFNLSVGTYTFGSYRSGKIYKLDGIVTPAFLDLKVHGLFLLDVFGNPFSSYNRVHYWPEGKTPGVDSSSGYVTADSVTGEAYFDNLDDGNYVFGNYRGSYIYTTSLVSSGTTTTLVSGDTVVELKVNGQPYGGRVHYWAESGGKTPGVDPSDGYVNSNSETGYAFFSLPQGESYVFGIYYAGSNSWHLTSSVETVGLTSLDISETKITLLDVLGNPLSTFGRIHYWPEGKTPGVDSSSGYVEANAETGEASFSLGTGNYIFGNYRGSGLYTTSLVASGSTTNLVAGDTVIELKVNGQPYGGRVHYWAESSGKTPGIDSSDGYVNSNSITGQASFPLPQGESYVFGHYYAGSNSWHLTSSVETVGLTSLDISETKITLLDVLGNPLSTFGRIHYWPEGKTPGVDSSSGYVEANAETGEASFSLGTGNYIFGNYRSSGLYTTSLVASGSTTNLVAGDTVIELKVNGQPYGGRVHYWAESSGKTPGVDSSDGYVNSNSITGQASFSLPQGERYVFGHYYAGSRSWHLTNFIESPENSFIFIFD